MIGCLVVILLALAAPGLVAFGWHVVHRQPQRYERYSIVVPGPFIAWRTSGGVRLVRLKIIASSDIYLAESILFKHDYSHATVEAWKERGPLEAKNVKGAKYFSTNVGDNQSPCIELDGANPDNPAAAFCKLQDDVIVEYQGEQQDIGYFRDVLQHLSLSRAHP
jgi:hypothetical protein